MPTIEEIQWTKLQQVLNEITAGNWFFRERTPPVSSLAAFKAEVPLLTKDDLCREQEAHPPFGRLLSFPRDAYHRFSQTSGTCGRPLHWLDTRESWAWMLGCWQKLFPVVGIQPGMPCFFGFSFGPFLGFWTAWDAASALGCCCIPGGALSTAARASLLVTTQSEALFCTPTYAIRLGEYLAEHSMPSAVRKIIVAGEPGGSLPEIRSLLASLWPDASVYDHHGMTEIGPVSVPCPSGEPNLRVLEEDYIAEVLDPHTLQPLPPGATGELVLTNLGRRGMPLLRYRTGDLVTLLPRVPDAPDSRRFIGLAGGILARSDDMIVVRGVNLYPGSIDRVVRTLPGIAEYRVRVTQSRSMREIELLIECTPPTNAPSLTRALEEKLAAAFGLRVPVQTVTPGSLPRFEMKANRWEIIDSPPHPDSPAAP